MRCKGIVDRVKQSHKMRRFQPMKRQLPNPEMPISKMLGISVRTPDIIELGNHIPTLWVRFVDVRSGRSNKYLHGIVAGAKQDGAENVDSQMRQGVYSLHLAAVASIEQEVVCIRSTLGGRPPCHCDIAYQNEDCREEAGGNREPPARPS